MLKLLTVFAVTGIAGAPALAQTAPTAGEAPGAKPKMVKKLVCKRVEEEMGTGSRLGAQSKVCREVEVPAPADKETGSSDPDARKNRG
jgi:hypothetical protein